MKIIGSITPTTGMVLQPGYPKIECTEDNVTVRMAYVAGLKSLKSLPKIGDKYTGVLPSSSEIETVVLQKVTCTAKAEGGPYMLELEYGPEPLYDEVSGSGKNRVWKSYEMSTDDLDVPLEQHPQYLACWNHVLLAQTGVTDVPAWWETATGTDVITGDSYKWGKAGEAPGEGWHVLKAETKPGVESFRDGCVTVTVTKVCMKRAAFDAEAKRRDYTVCTPGKTFGVAGSWLRGGSSICREGRRWKMTTQYINSKHIDPDLYET